MREVEDSARPCLRARKRMRGCPGEESNQRATVNPHLDLREITLVGSHTTLLYAHFAAQRGFQDCCRPGQAARGRSPQGARAGTTLRGTNHAPIKVGTIAS